MKKLITVLSMAIGATLVHGQGYVIVQSSAAGISTNTSSYLTPGVGTFVSGKTMTAANSYYYALLFSATQVTGNTSPTSASWTQVTQNGGAALAINNYNILSGGITGTGTSGGAQVDLAAGTTYYAELVGWSAGLGTSWSSVETGLANGSLAAGNFIGWTSEATITPFVTAGAGDPTIFPSTWSAGSLTLYSTTVPEPGTIALAAIGGASLLFLRRKK